MAKLKREALAHYLDTAWNKKVADADKAVFEILGDDIEDMSVEMNADTSQMKNILGQTKTTDNGFTPSMSADPWYANTDSKLYPHMRDIVLEQISGDERKTLLLEVIVEDTEATQHTAYVREVKVTPTSYGGGTEGVNIPFNVDFDGAFVKGTVTAESIKAGAPVFTAASASLTD
ncbi:MAG: hypothetical protein IJ485_02580 [Lachnospiraceae bacterium]|nr:hypothetical protein [Lachnospiraceae bacterium]